MHRPGRIKEGDVVLLYQNNFPAAFLHVVEIKPDPSCVNGNGNYVTLMRLEIPAMMFVWQLNHDHLADGEFAMNNIPCKLQVISRPNLIPKSEKKAEPEVKNNTQEGLEEL